MSNKQEFHIWEGVYDNWDDVPEFKDEAFNSSKWLDTLTKELNVSFTNFEESGGVISKNALSRDYILSVAAAMIKENGRKLKILDFGGGLGSSYFSVLASLHSSDGLEFHVVEGQEVCNIGEELFSNNMNIYFHEEIPVDFGNFDIIHAGRSFQYVDDWQELLSKFITLNPSYLILAGALAGDIKSFVSTQYYYGNKIKVRFLNLKELVDGAEMLGFNLIYKSLHVSKRMGKEGPLMMNNFPNEHQLEFPCQLLFKLQQ